MEKKLVYCITLHQKWVEGDNKGTFIERIVDDFDIAKQLLEGVYKDAEKGRVDKRGIKYTNPKWLNESHTKIQVTADININGWLHCTHIQTYELHDEWSANLYSDKPWVLE